MVTGRWRRYWFPVGGRLNAAVARIAVALSVLLMLDRLHDHALIVAPDRAPVASYDPVGILMLLGDPPPSALVSAAYLLAWLATTALLVGVWTRIAAAVSLGASLLVVSFTVSFTPEWPHDNNLPLLALFAVQGTQGGEALGVDGWLRRRRGLPAPTADGYEWTPRLVQLVAALVFLGAAMFKLAHARFTLAWALSDNLRHQILWQFDLNHFPRTELADWLIAEPWRYRTAAMLNLINQVLPVFACVAVRWPRLRAFFGFCFVAEVLGIGLVMGLWNLHWLPLVAVFVDWDRLVTWARRRSAVASSAEPSPPAAAPSPRHRRRVSIFLIAFVGYDLLITFSSPRIDHRLRTYPFSAYPMFAIIRARKPYDEHVGFQFVHGRFRVVSGGADASRAEDWLHRNYTYRQLYRLDASGPLRERLTQALAGVRARFPELSVQAIQLWATIYDAPAYPAPPRLEPHDVGLMGELTVDGAWTSAFTRLAPQGDRVAVTALPPHLDLRDASLAVHIDGAVTPRALPFERRGDDLVFELPSGNIVMVALHARRADGTPLTLLLARRTRKAWW